MIKSGGPFFYDGKRCIIGAVIMLRGSPYAVTASHIFRRGEEDHLTIDGIKLTATKILRDFDLALIELPPDCKFEITGLRIPAELEQAMLVNNFHTINCRVVNAGASLLFLGFQCYNMPEQGDSGSPIVQEGKVIGLISSVTLDTCMGIAISSSIIRSLENYENQTEGERNKTHLKKQKSIRDKGKEKGLFREIRSLLKFSNNLQHYFSYLFNSVKIYVYNLLPGSKCQVFFNKRDCKARTYKQ